MITAILYSLFVEVQRSVYVKDMAVGKWVVRIKAKISSLESNLGLLRSLKIGALN